MLIHLRNNETEYFTKLDEVSKIQIDYSSTESGDSADIKIVFGTDDEEIELGYDLTDTKDKEHFKQTRSRLINLFGDFETPEEAKTSEY